jgi:hypothetical protein
VSLADTLKKAKRGENMLLRDKVDLSKKWKLYAGNSIYNKQDYEEMDSTRQGIIMDTDVILVDETSTEQWFESRYCPPVNHHGENTTIEITPMKKKMLLPLRLLLNIFVFLIRMVFFLIGFVVAALAGIVSMAGNILAKLFGFFYTAGFILIVVLLTGIHPVDKGMIFAIIGCFTAGFLGTLFATSLGDIVSGISSMLVGTAIKIKYF